MKYNKLGLTSILFWSFSAASYASHIADIEVDTILGDGNGTYQTLQTHDQLIHHWYTFDLFEGETAQFTVSSPSFDSHLWLFDVLDDYLEAGDLLGVDYFNAANKHMGTGEVWSYTATAATSGQFGLQFDSYLGGQGNYTLTISGASVSQVPEPLSLVLLGLGLAGFSLSRKKKTDKLKTLRSIIK